MYVKRYFNALVMGAFFWCLDDQGLLYGIHLLFSLWSPSFLVTAFMCLVRELASEDDSRHQLSAEFLQAGTIAGEAKQCF